MRINCDLGESGLVPSYLDEKIMPLIDSCNIACGGHAGDDQSIAYTIKLAKEHRVAIGIHPSYPDKATFGRQYISMTGEALASTINDQLINFKKIATNLNAEVHHIKPHGALYNRMAIDKREAEIVCESISNLFPGIILYGLADSPLSIIACHYELIFHHETFADRRYTDDLKLKSRELEGAFLNVQEAIDQAQLILTENTIVSDTYKEFFINSDTICVHGDTDGAIDIIRGIKSILPYG